MAALPSRHRPSTGRWFVCVLVVTVGSLGLLGVMPLAHAASRSASVGVKATIEPWLELDVEPATGSTIDFGRLRPSATDAVQSPAVPVDIHVRSNLGTPYTVTHALPSPLVTREGLTLPSELLMATAQGGAHGTPTTTTHPLTPIPAQAFASDTHGRSDAFTVSYQLTVPSRQPAGTYESIVQYTVVAE